MNRYKRSAARSEPQTLNNTDDGIYFVTNGSTKVPNIISRNPSRRSVSNSTTLNNATTMSTCLSQNQQVVVEENIQEQLLVEQQIPGVQEMTTEHVQIVQHPGDANSGLMYFLLEDGTLAQLDTSVGTPWLNNENVELQFDGEQQQFVKENMIVVDSQLSTPQETISEQQQMGGEETVTESGQPMLDQSVLVSGESQESISQVRQNDNDRPILQEQQEQSHHHDIYSQDTQPLDMENIKEQKFVQNDQSTLSHEHKELLHQTLDSSSSLEVGLAQKQINLQASCANQQEQQQVKGDVDDVFTTNMESISNLVQSDSTKEDSALTSLLATPSQIKEEEKPSEAQNLVGHDGENQRIINSTEESTAIVKMEDDQQQDENGGLMYFLLDDGTLAQIDTRLCHYLSSQDVQQTGFEVMTQESTSEQQEINLTEHFGSTVVNNQCESRNVPLISPSTNMSDNISSIPVLNSVPNDDVSVNFVSDEDRPKPYRFVLPSPAASDQSLESLVKPSPVTSPAHRQPSNNDVFHDDVNGQPPMKRFKGQSEEFKTETTKKTSIIRPGVGSSSTGLKTKMNNTCVYRCGACHKLYPTKEEALQHMIEVHKAEFRSTESPKRSCPKCGVAVHSLNQHNCTQVSGVGGGGGYPSNEKSHPTFSSALTRFDGSSKTKQLNQLEAEKSDFRVQATIAQKSSLNSIVVASSSFNATSVNIKDSSKESSQVSLLNSSSFTVEDQNTTTSDSVQNSSKLRTTPSSQLNLPPTLTCSCCKLTFVSLYYYLYHGLIQSRASKNSSDPWQCEVCLVEFLTKRELLSHFFCHNIDYTPPRKLKSKTVVATSSTTPTPNTTGRVRRTSVKQINSDNKDHIDNNSTPDQTTSKRKRGRPPKAQSSNNDDSSIHVEQEQETIETKRNRGRPKKYLQDDDTPSKSVNILEISGGRRPARRAVVQKSVHDDNGNDQKEPTGSTTMTTTTTKSTTRLVDRRIGRSSPPDIKSQKRVQDSFVEIFKRVKRNSAENSLNRNGGGKSGKLV